MGAENSPAKLMIDSSEKRKRGRPPRGVATKALVPKRKRVEKEEGEEGEDVCFICFDGGSLVLCDHKGCPKAYHPACIKRDEAFFRAAAKWTCGWHICSVCQKGSRYMCYTCTYSVCKGCTKNADYFCVRGNKGFCSTCMRIIMLIENIDQGNKEMVQVDFDDKSSWEHLFKVYWMYLKEKLSLTVSELIQAKNPWKEPDAVHAKRQRLPFCHRVVLDGEGIVGKSFDHLELKKPKQLLEPPYKDPSSSESRTTTDSENSSVSGCAAQLELMQPIELELRCKDSLKTEEGSIAIKTSLTGSVEWASKELLELVAHMKNGDSSALSHFDVQALLLEYIKSNNLRDPRRKSQIICDSRLKSIFGKPRVGHIEMLKLLEFHFLIKEDSQKSEFVPAGIVGTVTSHAEPDDNNDISLLKNKAKKRKSRGNSEEKLMQINLDEYAAIDAHNINLIYLRRDLMESLIEDTEKFHGRVIGSLVRIRISSGDQKQEMYRLVRVVGISKAAVPYKIRDKTADVLLEVLNLNKKEAVTIDSISNQDFSEDECRRLRQIIKCGIVKRLTVGEIQKKAMELRAIKLNDSLEAEILRLSHLRDRASEKGRKKELRECVEKLELLKMPEERQRRLLAIPRVHADPKMDAGYESEEDARESDRKKQVEHAGPRYTKFSRREDKLMSPCRKAKEGSIMARCKISEKRGAHGNNILMKLGNQSTACQAADRSASETSTASLSIVNSTSANNSEAEKLWHYRDPSGRIQGPFSVVQLRKWNKSGLFPRDMRIWTNDEHHDSVLLINALNGLFQKAPRVHGEISHQSQEFGVASGNSRVGRCESATGTGRECGEREVQHLHITNNHSNGMTGIARMDRLSSFPQCLDLNNSYSDKPKASNTVPSSSNGDMDVTPLHGKGCHEIVDFHSITGHVVQDSSGSTTSQTSDGYNHSMQSNNQSHLVRSSGQKWESLASNRSSISMNSESSIDSATKLSDSFEQKVIKDFPDLPSPTPKTSYDDCEALAAEELLSLSSGVPVSASDIQDLPSPTPKLKGEAADGQAAANKETSCSYPVQDSGHSWSSASSLVTGGTQLPEIAAEWGGHSPGGKPSVDSGEAPDGQAAANKESSSIFPVQDSGHSRSSASSQVAGGAQLPEIAIEWGGHSPGEKPSVDCGEATDGQAAANKESSSNFPVQDSGHSRSSASSQVTGEAQLPEIAREWGGHLPGEKPSVDCGEAPDGQAAANKESFSSFPVQDSGHSWSSASSQVTGGAQLPEIGKEGGGHSPGEKPSLDSGEAPGGQAAANKESSSNFPVQDSGHSWSSASSQVGGGAQHSEIAKEWGGHSPGEKSSVDSGVVSVSSLKPAEAVGDHVDTPTSDANHLNQTSPSNPVSNFFNWEPIEFTTLDEESVSDLLAEVDAMESQTRSAMGSPTSTMRCSDELVSASISDCFSSIEELSPMLDPAKNDALSSTDDIQLPCLSSLTDELAGASQADAFDPLKRSSGNLSSSNVVETKSAEVSFAHGEAGSNVPTPRITGQEASVSLISRSTGVGAITTGYRAAPGNMNSGGPLYGFASVGNDISMVTAWGNSHMNHASFTGNPVFESQCIYSGKRSDGDGPREWVVPVGHSGFDRDRSYRQPFVGGEYSMPPKEQRVCKFYEIGRCRKGASCDYLHL